MDTFKDRFPTRQEIYQLFLASAFPIHVWAIIVVMQEVPAYILRMSLAEMIGTIAYTLLFALLDSVLLWIGVLALCLLLPPRYFRGRLVAAGTAAAFVTAGWFIFLHFNGMINARQVVPLVVWGLTYLLVLAAVIWGVARFDRFHAGVNNIMQRLAVLSVLYLFIDVISIVIIVIRNV